jgi:hypothetical protein
MVLVHRRKSGRTEVRRADEFTKRPKAPKTPPPHHLHYRSKERTNVCRCENSVRHKYSFSVASDSAHLEADIIRYLDRKNIDAYSMNDFRASQQQQRNDWSRVGVYIKYFHYATAQKDVVCRCTKPNNHEQGPVRNFEIVELCAELFRKNKDKMTCTKTQWRAALSAPPENNEPKDTGAPLEQKIRKSTPAAAESPRSDAFRYDSLSTVELLQACANRAFGMPISSRKADMEHLRSGTSCEADIPEQVWIKARPSVWNDRRVSETAASTPLGSVTTPRLPVAEVLPLTRTPRPEPVAGPHRVSVATVWSRIQRDAAGVSYNVSPSSSAGSPTPTRTDSVVGTFGVDSLQEHIRSKPLAQSSSRRALQDSLYSNGLEVSPEMASSCISDDSNQDQLLPRVYELPARHISAELPARQRQAELFADSTPEIDSHAFTLRELEGNQPQSYSDGPGKQSCISVESSLLSQKTTKTSSGLFSIFNELEDTIDLPNQEEFLLRHVAVCSRTKPPPPGDCSLCKGPNNDRRKRYIGLPGCGHFMHEECLVADFRVRDDNVGRCPMCSLALCIRDLADCIETDRKAIFGSQHTPLHEEVSIEFQSRGQVVRLQSEEEVAAAQLRLLKDYIDVHAEEHWHHWPAHGTTEPDWFAEVIRPVIKLFAGWNLPSQQNRYFSDRDAFLKFVAWAELVRLMNVTRTAILRLHGPSAPFRPLTDLHCKLLWSRSRYDKEKKTWKTNHRGILECEKVAQDAYDLATSTQLKHH